jgi:hypothetical protein
MVGREERGKRKEERGKKGLLKGPVIPTKEGASIRGLTKLLRKLVILTKEGLSFREGRIVIPKRSEG